MPVAQSIHACLELTRSISHTRTVEEIYEAALDALAGGLGVERSSILLFDPDGVMRFKAWRGLSDTYRAAVEGHTPWRPDTPDPQPIVVEDVEADPELEPYRPVFRAEGIRALGFIPLVSLGRVIGKFMLYYPAPTKILREQLALAGVMAAQVAFAVERTRTEAAARRSEERLRFALDAAAMGTWDWDIRANTFSRSENLERLHGVAPGTFDGTLQTYQQRIHPDDRERVSASLRRAVTEGAPHEVEYRFMRDDGTTLWAEGKGRVEFENGAPVRMSGVCMIVTRRKEAELARLEAAHEAARLKDEFLAVLSHELRTPLNAILGWVQMLESAVTPVDRIPDAVRIIGRNARMQAQLIEDILDVSRIISGKLDIERQTISLHQLIATAANTALPAALAKKLDMNVDVPPELPAVIGDPHRLQQVLGNVLSNAIKFTDEGGRITVRAAARPGEVTLEVTDTGAGIAADFLPFVFDRFRQADSGSTRRHGGLGLGLAIAKSIVDLHGGSITITSDGVGLGTTIRIALPASDRPAEDGRAPEPVETGRALPRGARVLVVDDHADSCELLRTVFESAGAIVATAGSAAEALAHARQFPVDLLVADIAMPEVDGYALLPAFRVIQPGAAALAVSAYARPEDRARSEVAGFDAYHAKPITAAALLAAASDLLERRAAAGADQ
ncbi:MAG TPA: ATP-binding protein [Vicinamibacterales bacterium]|nr:ATP-binding protein [Vicinamibacterales bacterium]